MIAGSSPLLRVCCLAYLEALEVWTALVALLYCGGLI